MNEWMNHGKESVGEAVTIATADWKVNLWFDRENDKSTKDHNYPPVNHDPLISNLRSVSSLHVSRRLRRKRTSFQLSRQQHRLPPIDQWSNDSHLIVLFGSLRTRIIDRSRFASSRLNNVACRTVLIQHHFVCLILFIIQVNSVAVNHAC